MEPPRLPDEAIVIRGGINDSRHMQEQAEEEFAVGPTHLYSLSVAADATWTLDRIARTARFENRQIRKSTVGRLRAIGCDVSWPTGRRRHANLILPQPPTDTVWIDLEQAFDPPELNPHRRNRG